MICENCGSSDIKATVIEGYKVDECEVCQQLHGDPESIESILEIREAKELGIAPQIYPLHKILQKVAGFCNEYSCSGFAQEKVPPYISFRVVDNGYKNLEKLAAEMVTINKATNVHWILEASYQRRLVFILKPNFHHDPYHISPEQISLAQKDLAVIHEHLAGKI